MIKAIPILACLMVAVSVHADSFTVVSNGVDWSYVDVWNETITAYNEVYDTWAWSPARGNVATSGVMTVGSDMQDRLQAPSYYAYRNVQDDIEDMVDSGAFIDTSIPATNFSSPQILTLTSLWAQAGMTTNGWRRATSYDPGVDDWTDQEDAMFSYGQMQIGDIIGNWVWADLQSCLLLMDTTWKVHANTSAFNMQLVERWQNVGGTYTNFSDLLDDFTDAWDADSVATNDFTGDNYMRPASYGLAVAHIEATGRFGRQFQVYINAAYALSAEGDGPVSSSNCVVKLYAPSAYLDTPFVGSPRTNYYDNPLTSWGEGDVHEFPATWTYNASNDFTQQWETAWIFTNSAETVDAPANLLTGAWSDHNSYLTANSLLWEGIEIVDLNGDSWWQVKLARTYTD